MAKQNITISGQIVNKNNLPLAGLRVEAWDKDLLIDDFVGEAVSDNNGLFTISFTANRFKDLFMDRKLDLFFKIFQKENFVCSTENDIIWNIENSDQEITITIDLPLINNNALLGYFHGEC